MTQEDKQFDAQVRGCLSEAREEVPEGLWAAISKRLDAASGAAIAGAAGAGATAPGQAGTVAAAGAGRTGFPFWRRAAIGLSLAAAAALGVLLLLPRRTATISPEAIAVTDREPASERVAPDETSLSSSALAVNDSPASQARTGGLPASPAGKDSRTQASGPQNNSTAAIGTLERDEAPAPKAQAADPEGLTASDPLDGKAPHSEAEGRTEERVKEAAANKTEPGADPWTDKPAPRKWRRSVALTVRGDLMNNSAQTPAAKMGWKAAPGLGTPSSTTISQLGKQSSQGIPLSAGVGLRVQLSPRWGIGSGVDYTFLSRRFSGTYTRVEGGMVTEKISADIVNQQHYVGIPLTVYYDVLHSEFVKLYAHAGGKMEKCVANRFRVLAPSGDRYHKESVAGFQFSAGLGVGVEWRIAKRIGIYADPSLRYYFDNGQPTSFRTQDPLRIGLDIGARFTL